MYIKTNDIVKTDDEPSSSLCTGQGDISDQMRSHNTDSSPQMAQSTPYTISRALAPVNLIKSHKLSRSFPPDNKFLEQSGPFRTF